MISFRQEFRMTQLRVWGLYSAVRHSGEGPSSLALLLVLLLLLVVLLLLLLVLLLVLLLLVLLLLLLLVLAGGAVPVISSSAAKGWFSGPRLGLCLVASTGTVGIGAATSPS
jgi:hypothetical protein